MFVQGTLVAGYESLKERGLSDIGTDLNAMYDEEPSRSVSADFEGVWC